MLQRSPLTAKLTAGFYACLLILMHGQLQCPSVPANGRGASGSWRNISAPKHTVIKRMHTILLQCICCVFGQSAPFAQCSTMGQQKLQREVSLGGVSRAESTSSSDHKDVKSGELAAVKGAEGGYDPNKFVLSPSGELISLSATGEELITTAPPYGVPQRGGKIWNRDDWLRMPGETWPQYLFRLVFEGHTVFDAFLLISCGQIGQVMQTNPWALYSTGVASGGAMWAWSTLVGFWTVWNYLSLYLEFKRDKIRDGSWWETNGHHKYVHQWFEVVGHHLGAWARWVSMFIVLFATSGTCITQPVASAASMYSVDPSRSKREWALIFGGSMFLLVVFIPRFTKFRLLNIIGMVGTFFAACYIVDQARRAGWAPKKDVNLWPVTSEMRPGTSQIQNWFNGIVILIGETAGHSFIIESLESMENPVHYRRSYIPGIMFIMFVTIPHAFALNFSNFAPSLVKAASSNMYAVLPFISMTKKASVIMMITHFIIAYLLYGTQACIAWEKITGVHTKAYWIRCLVRLPLAGFWFFMSLLLPFYGNINSFFASLGGTIVSFTFLAAASIKLYWKKERRDTAVLPPFKWLQWRGWILPIIMNAHIALAWTAFGIASLYYAVLTIKQTASTWGFMPECFGCPPNWQELTH